MGDFQHAAPTQRSNQHRATPNYDDAAISRSERLADCRCYFVIDEVEASIFWGIERSHAIHHEIALTWHTDRPAYLVFVKSRAQHVKPPR
jgi:hypothetical protein